MVAPAPDANHTYAVGDGYPHVGLAEGIVYAISNGGKQGKIVSLDEKEELWSTEEVITHATNTTDGKANMTTIKGITDWENKYPAFKWCADKGNSWYLPAKDELKALYGSYNTYGKTAFNDKLTAGGGVEFANGEYWSSSEINADGVWIINFISGDGGEESYKKQNYYVRVVSAF